MAQLYTTGPAHLYVAFPSGSYSNSGWGYQTPVYLGTAENAPHVEIVPVYENVVNDIGGTVPFDKSFQGEYAMIDLDLNRYNETVYSIMAARPRVGAPGTLARGTNGPGDVGSLILTEGLSMQLYMLFSFGAAGPAPKAAYTSGGLPAGYRFPACVPIGPDKINAGTKPKKVNVMMYGLRLWLPSTLTFTLYDSNMAGLPAIN